MVATRLTKEKRTELEQLQGLLTGETLGLVQQELKKVESIRDETVVWMERFMSADREIVRDVVRELLSDKKAKEELPVLQEILFETKPQHCNITLLLAAIRAKIPVWIYGDTGSGKTTAASQVSEMLEIPFRFISVCPTTTKSELFGYNDAAGNYHSTAFREIFEHGGVFLIDEIDNGNPSILSVLNAALANNWCAFPDGNIERHENAVFVAAANTIGRGADTKYVGRNALDATTLDRFVFVRMDIDEDLEEAIVNGTTVSSAQTDISEGGRVQLKTWIKFIRDVRRACHALGLEHIVSPRAMIYGSKLLSVGVGVTHVENMCVWKGIRETDKKKIIEFIQKGGR
jgi:hypothetical protein